MTIKLAASNSAGVELFVKTKGSLRRTVVRRDLEQRVLQ